MFWLSSPVKIAKDKSENFQLFTGLLTYNSLSDSVSSLGFASANQSKLKKNNDVVKHMWLMYFYRCG